VSDPSLTKSIVRKLIPRTVRNWLRSPTATVHFVWDELCAFGGAMDLELRSGWHVQCHPAAYRQYLFQIRDPDQTAEFDSFIATCRRGMRFLDVGASFGIFSLAALHYGGGMRERWRSIPLQWLSDSSGAKQS